VEAVFLPSNGSKAAMCTGVFRDGEYATILDTCNPCTGREMFPEEQIISDGIASELHSGMYPFQAV
jgi:hypothetical protein